jgi:deoxyribodipyrimidine photo-lyase
MMVIIWVSPIYTCTRMVTYFIFRRNLRIEDNLLLLKEHLQDVNVLLLFFDPRQLTRALSDYYNPRSASIFVAAAMQLRERLGQLKVPLNIIEEDQLRFLEKILRKGDCVYDQFDVTPFARNRQDAIQEICDRVGGSYILCHDASILPVGTILTGSKTCFKKYTPFYRATLAAVKRLGGIQLYPSYDVVKKHSQSFKKLSAARLTRGKWSASADFGDLRREALSRMVQIKNYKRVRDIPSLNSTTHLSHFLHFGIISPREFWKTYTSKNPNRGLIEQIIWRDFYMNVVFYYHTDYNKRADTLSKMNGIPWTSDTTGLSRWCSARTGIPFVDAGIRELLATGYMHNRMRMVVAMFLIHYLRVHWSAGERFFAQQLIDYSYCNNFGGWVWCAGTEVHSNTWYRIFSMEKQMQRYDPDGAYVKLWIPELAEVPVGHLYNWPKFYKKYAGAIAKSYYIEPIISDLTAARESRIKEIRHALQ